MYSGWDGEHDTEELYTTVGGGAGDFSSNGLDRLKPVDRALFRVLRSHGTWVVVGTSGLGRSHQLREPLRRKGADVFEEVDNTRGVRRLFARWPHPVSWIGEEPG